MNWWGISLFDHSLKVDQFLTQTKPYNIYDMYPDVIRYPGQTTVFIVVDGGIRTHDPITHGLSTTPCVKELVGCWPV